MISIQSYRDDKAFVMHFMEVEHWSLAARRNQALNHAEPHLRLRAIFQDSIKIFPQNEVVVQTCTEAE
jgi:hypothetical protein